MSIAYAVGSRPNGGMPEGEEEMHATFEDARSSLLRIVDDLYQDDPQDDVVLYIKVMGQIMDADGPGEIDFRSRTYWIQPAAVCC